MSERSREFDAATLLAFADDRLPGEAAEAVTRYLAEHPEAAAEVEAHRRQNAAISALFTPVRNEPVPARLKPERVAAGLRAQAGQWYRSAAAAIIVLALGAGGGWYGRDALSPAEAASDVLIDTAVTAHELYVNEKRHAVEVAAAEEDHLVTWLSNRIGQTIDAPDLTTQGFTLVGGRLLPSVTGSLTGPAAQLMYENATADRLTVYITAALPDKLSAYEFTARSGLDAFYWANEAITCTVVGDLPEEAMQVVAKQVYTQLTWRPDGKGYQRGL